MAAIAVIIAALGATPPPQLLPTSRPADRWYLTADEMTALGRVIFDVDDMSPTEKRDYRAAKLRLVRNCQKRVERLMCCPACTKTIRPTKTHKQRACEKCGGSTIYPRDGAHAALADYYREVRKFQYKYRFEKGTERRIENWMFDNLRTERAARVLTFDAYDQLCLAQGRPGDIYVMVARTFAVKHREGELIVQASLLGPAGYRDRDQNLWLVLPPETTGIVENTVILVIAYDEGDLHYKSVLGSERSARALTVQRWDRIIDDYVPGESNP